MLVDIVRVESKFVDFLVFDQIEATLVAVRSLQ